MLILVKYKLCPSVQHAAISIIENGAACERVNMNMTACRAGSPPSRRQARFPLLRAAVKALIGRMPGGPQPARTPGPLPKIPVWQAQENGH